MSDIRKQFEDWFEAESMPAEANWFARDEDGFYKLGYVQWAREAWEKSRQSCWQEAAEIAEKLHDEYVEKEQFKWPEMRTEAAAALGEIQAIFEAKSRGES